MIARSARGRRRRKARRGSDTVLVTEEERRHLVEDCAFFRADRFREAGPGAVRRQDVSDAAADIDSVIARPRNRGRRRP